MSAPTEEMPTMSQPRQHNPRFLTRQGNGTSRIRLTFEPDETARMEEAAGDRDIASMIHKWIKAGVARELAEQRATRKGPIAPPPEGA